MIYHADCLDGFGAAFSAWCHLGENADYWPAEHGDEPPDTVGRDVFILDFSYNRPVLLDLRRHAANVTLLDHHKTAQADLARLDFAVFDINRSGCVMAWEYFNPKQPIPKMLLYIQDRDLGGLKSREPRRLTKPYTICYHGRSAPGADSKMILKLTS